MYRRPETKAAEEKVYKQKQIGEFMTTWKDFPRPGLAAWAERQKVGLMGTAKSTRYTPRFRPFDMLSIPNQSLVILENEYHRIGVESVVGVQDSFHRYIDSDMVYFQFCGSSKVETEFGVYDMEPGEVMLVPGGIAHRSIGRNDSLRYFCQSHEAVDYVMNEDQYTSQTSFEVKRIGGPNWTAPQGTNASTKGPVVEKMHFWDDGRDDQTVVERDYESLVGAAGIGRGKPGSLVRKLRAFDHFTAIVGKGREDAGTQPLMESANMRIRTYNMQDEQFAFHRALRSEEVRIQFRGDALDLSEFENVEVFPGEITIIPLGISHSVISIPPEDENFLRLNFYSKVRWRVPMDPTKHYFDSKFEIKTTVHKQAEWREKLAAAR
jgi:mannose-6-phosphate isomerase-like protein (cupin superfamily)